MGCSPSPEEVGGTNVNSRVHPRLHEQWLLLIWSCTLDPKFDLSIRNTEFLVAEACQMSHILQKRIKQSYESKRLQSLVLQFRQRRSHLAYAIVRCCTSVDTRTYDRTCLRAWTEGGKGFTPYRCTLCSYKSTNVLIIFFVSFRFI